MTANSKKLTATDALAMLDALKQNYMATVSERFDEIEDLVMRLTREPHESELYQELYRKVHSLKGGAGTYGVQIISTVCHQFEDYLGHWGTHTSQERAEFTDIALAYVDVLRAALQRVAGGGEGFGEIEELLSQLKARGASEQHNVLLVTASRSTQRLCLGLLESLPVRVSIAEDGMMALQRLLHERFDLLLTGMEVPVLNGIALIAAMRLSKGANTETKAVLLTSGAALEMPRTPEPDLVVHRDAEFAAGLVNAAAELLGL